MTYNLFIGANNDTGAVEVDKIKDILVEHNLGGFTIIPALGYWVDNGKTYDENSVLVILDTDAKTLKSILKVLCIDLKQEAVASRTAKLQFFSN